MPAGYRLDVFAGPNLLAPYPCASLTMRVLDDLPSSTICAELRDAFLGLLNSPKFFSPGLDVTELIAVICLNLQHCAGCLVERFESRHDTSGETISLFEIEVPELAVSAVTLVMPLVQALLKSDEVAGSRVRAALPDRYRQFLELAASFRLDDNARFLLQKARIRGLPACRTGDRSVVFGMGRHRRLMYDGGFDIWVAAGFALTPMVIHWRLAYARLPVPGDILAEDVNDAIHKARELNWPVILRTPDYSQVSDPLWSGADVRRVFQELKSPEGVILSRSLDGDIYRFLVIGGQVVSVLHHAQLTAPDGTCSSGTHTRELLESVHPETKALAERVAHVLELDAAGIDIRTNDATRSWRKVGGVVVAVDYQPPLVAHASPDTGVVQDVAERIFDHLFPSGTPHSIPVAAVTGTCGKTTTCRMLEAILARTGKCVGLATTHGVRIGGREIVSGDCSGAVYAQLVLYNRDVEAAVLETARGGILSRGLGFEACNVAGVLNVSNDHLGERGIETVDDMAKVKGFLLERARDAVVLNADDPSCVGMVSRVAAKDLYWFTLTSESPLVHAHIEAGGRAFRRVGEGNAAQIVLHEGRDSTPLLAVSELPSAFNGLALHNVANAMAAAAMAHALGVPMTLVRDALAGFQPNAEINPGRLNVFDGHPFKVIVDMTKNIAAYRALVDMVGGLEVTGQRIAVLSVTGHQRNTDIKTIGELVSGKFDRFVLFTSGDQGTPDEMSANPDATDKYGRHLHEVPELLKQILTDTGVAPDRIAIVPHRMQAVDCGLRMARAGDLVVVKCNTEPELFWDRVVAYKPSKDQR